MEKFHVPGGLICVGLAVDPTLTPADRLVGQVRRFSGGSARFNECMHELRVVCSHY
jgi:translation initiation factor 2 gamma subunit (eIF-2gamma)